MKVHVTTKLFPPIVVVIVVAVVATIVKCRNQWYDMNGLILKVSD